MELPVEGLMRWKFRLEGIVRGWRSREDGQDGLAQHRLRPTRPPHQHYQVFYIRQKCTLRKNSLNDGKNEIWVGRLIVNTKVATALGLIPASYDSMESEGGR
jgi:hypothetical protein